MSEMRALRHSVGLCLDYIGITRRTVSPDLGVSLLFAATLNANTSYLDATLESSIRWAAFDERFPTALRRPIRVSRLSDSLGLPRQTARNKLARLCASGWASIGPSGVTVRPEPFFTEAGLASLGQYLEASARFIDLAAADGLGSLQEGEALIDPPFPAGWLIVRLSSNHVLQTLYGLRMAIRGGSPADDFILLHLIRESWSGGGGPLSVSELARRLCLPRETIRRRLTVLEARGLLLRIERDYLVAPELARHPQVLNAAAGLKVGLRKLVRRARDAGALTGSGAPSEP